MKIAFRAFLALCFTLVAYYCVKIWLTKCSTLGDFLLATIPSLFVVLADYVIFYSLLPKLVVENPILEVTCNKNLKYSIKIPVKNVGKYSALQVEIEACVFEKNNKNYTFHLQPDFSRYLMIPGSKIADDNERVFVFEEPAQPALLYITNINKAIKLLRGNNKLLRVRVYGTHAISGLGRGYEYFFKLDGCRFTLKQAPNYDKLISIIPKYISNLF